jgi:heme-degrading monooxygenase HmoA
MIVRMWHGRVPTSKADAYREFTNGRAIPDYQSVKGNISVHVLERREGDITHFITLTFWESLEAIKGFAGEDGGCKVLSGRQGLLARIRAEGSAL